MCFKHEKIHILNETKNWNISKVTLIKLNLIKNLKKINKKNKNYTVRVDRNISDTFYYRCDYEFN